MIVARFLALTLLPSTIQAEENGQVTILVRVMKSEAPDQSVGAGIRVEAKRNAATNRIIACGYTDREGKVLLFLEKSKGAIWLSATRGREVTGKNHVLPLPDNEVVLKADRQRVRAPIQYRWERYYVRCYYLHPFTGACCCYWQECRRMVPIRPINLARRPSNSARRLATNSRAPSKTDLRITSKTPIDRRRRLRQPQKTAVPRLAIKRRAKLSQGDPANHVAQHSN